MTSNEEKFFAAAAKDQPRHKSGLFLIASLALLLAIGTYHIVNRKTQPVEMPILGNLRESTQFSKAANVALSAADVSSQEKKVKTEKIQDKELWLGERIIGVWKSDDGETHTISEDKWVIEKQDGTEEEFNYTPMVLMTKDRASVAIYGRGKQDRAFNDKRNMRGVSFDENGELLLGKKVLHFVEKVDLRPTTTPKLLKIIWRGSAFQGIRNWIKFENMGVVGRAKDGRTISDFIEELQELFDILDSEIPKRTAEARERDQALKRQPLPDEHQLDKAMEIF